MYESIRWSPGKRRKRTLTLPLLFCAVVIGAVILSFVWAGRYQYRYREFTLELAEVTTEARESGGCTVTLDGKEIPVDDEMLSDLFYSISQAGSGRIGDAPETEPKITVDYGGGITLAIWIVTLENSGNDWTEGPFFRYTGRDGRTYGYDTDQLRPEVLLRLFR